MKVLSDIKFYITLISCTLLFSVSGFAFQKTDPYKLPEDLSLQKKQAEQLSNEEQWDESFATYQKVQQECNKRGLQDIGIQLYADMFTTVILRGDLDIETQIGIFNKYKNEETHPLFPGIYHGALAHLYAFNGVVDSMEYHYNLASTVYVDRKSPFLEAKLNINIAYEFLIAEDIASTKIYLQKSEVLLEEQLLPEIDIPDIYTLQSYVYYESGEYRKAIKSNLKILEMIKSDPLTSVLNLVSTYNNLATIYGAIQDYNNSLVYYQEAISLIKESGEYPDAELASLIYNLGSTYLETNDITLAKAAFLESLFLLDNSGITSKDYLSDYINNYHHLSDCYRMENNLDSALYYIEKAEKINATYPYRIASTYTSYGKVFHSQKNYKKAQEYFNLSILKSIEMYGPKNDFLADQYSVLINSILLDNDISNALLSVQKALEVISIDFSDPSGISNPPLKNVIYKSKLIGLLESKLKILNSLYQEDNSQINPEDIFASAKLATEVLEYMNKNMKNVQSKHTWLKQNAIPLFEQAIDLAIDIAQKTNNEAYLNEAFMLSERSKSMLMTEALQENTASTFGGVPPNLITQVQDLQRSLSDAEKYRFDAKMAGDAQTEQLQDSLIFHYKHELDAIKYTFETKYPKYFELKYATNVVSIKDVQKKLPLKTRLIEFFEGKRNIYVFVITNDKVDAFTVPKRASFRADIFNFLRRLIDIRGFQDEPAIAYNRFVDAASTLYQDLLQDAITEETDRLIIIPDGLLGYLPFGVLLQDTVPLLNQQDDEVDFSQLPYVLNDYSINYNYSATLLLSQKEARQHQSNNNILALAPYYESPDSPEWRGERERALRNNLEDLEGAVKEVRKLQESFAGTFLIGPNANERVFKNSASGYGILHLAMHGLVNQRNPEFSGLALTENQDSLQDNFLYAYEIKQLDLNADLIVLSACETGIGGIQEGEGIVSIGRSFMYAGAPALLMTLWRLNDYSGAIIIEEFYKNLKEGLEKDVAIQKAKLTYMEIVDPINTHPFLWAAFIQVGNYDAIKINPATSPLLKYLLGIGGAILVLFLFTRFTKSKTEA